jgi:Transposase
MRPASAHRGCLREPDPAPDSGEESGPAADPVQEAPPAQEPAGKFAERTRAHHAMVHGLLAEGHTLRAIARHLSWGRHTVQRYARAATWQELADGRWRAPRPSILDPFKPHLDQRAGDGCGNAAQLFREITALGYTGSYSTVRDYLDQHRPAAAPLPPPPPTVREVTGWPTRHPDSLTDDEKPQLKALLDRCPELQATSGHVRVFAAMLTQLTGQHLPQWISDAKAAGLPGLSSFAAGLEQDLDAVTQGLTSHWNSGPVEGRVNHIKMIKRQMYGRAELPLLRKRVLLTARD